MSRLFRTSVTSRERNRIHAQRTRQRKKEQMNGLQGRVCTLKQEQLLLRQAINEQNTANILVGIFARNTTSNADDANNCEDAKIEELLRRPIEEIPDPSKIPELPALILPGFQASKKSRVNGISNYQKELPGLEGIDYELLERDRSVCTPEQLDKIRRERNRMHAKRTRERKRMFTENLADMSRILQEENQALKNYLTKIDPDNFLVQSFAEQSTSFVSSNESSCCESLSADASPKFVSSGSDYSKMTRICLSSSFTCSSPEESECYAKSKNSLITLLEVAGCFEQIGYEGKAAVSVSGTSACDISSETDHGEPDNVMPRRRVKLSTDIPISVTMHSY